MDNFRSGRTGGRVFGCQKTVENQWEQCHLRDALATDVLGCRDRFVVVCHWCCLLFGIQWMGNGLGKIFTKSPILEHNLVFFQKKFSSDNRTIYWRWSGTILYNEPDWLNPTRGFAETENYEQKPCRQFILSKPTEWGHGLFDWLMLVIVARILLEVAIA